MYKVYCQIKKVFIFNLNIINILFLIKNEDFGFVFRKLKYE